MTKGKTSEKTPGSMACPNERLGCKVRGTDQEMSKHQSHCLFRHVECPACGVRILLEHLYTHQRRARCYENKLKQEVAQTSRRLNLDVWGHHLKLKREAAHRQMEEEKTFKTKLHEKTGFTPRVPPVLGRESPPLSARGSRCLLGDRPKTPRPSSRQARSPRTPISQPGTEETKESKSPTREDSSRAPSRCRSARSWAQDSELSIDFRSPTPETREKVYNCSRFPRSRSTLSNCQRCLKVFRNSHNHARACVQHEGVRTANFGELQLLTAI